jgi:hypothetical protein
VVGLAQIGARRQGARWPPGPGSRLLQVPAEPCPPGVPPGSNGSIAGPPRSQAGWLLTRFLVVTLGVGSCLLVACGVVSGATDNRAAAPASAPAAGGEPEANGPTASLSPAGADPRAGSTTTAAGTDPASTDPVRTGPPSAWCAGLSTKTDGAVANRALTELSGLAASHRHPGVLWAHNDSGNGDSGNGDSGNETAIFAIGPGGEDLGVFALPGVVGVDIEDIALAGDQIYLADIGDNRRQRDEALVYRFAEPDPSKPGLVREVETLHLRYPDGPHDAEALLVDPTSGELVVIDKQFKLASGDTDTLLTAAPAEVFVGTPPFSDKAVVDLRAEGEVSLDRFKARLGTAPAGSEASQLGLGGVATGADIRADGLVIAVRTYDTIWVFDRSPGQSVATALTGTPCEAPAAPEQQGEAIAFLPGDGVHLATASEGSRPELHLISSR